MGGEATTTPSGEQAYIAVPSGKVGEGCGDAELKSVGATVGRLGKRVKVGVKVVGLLGNSVAVGAIVPEGNFVDVGATVEGVGNFVVVGIMVSRTVGSEGSVVDKTGKLVGFIVNEPTGGLVTTGACVGCCCWFPSVGLSVAIDILKENWDSNQTCVSKLQE